MMRTDLLSHGRRPQAAPVALAFALMLSGQGIAVAHPDGAIGCRAQVTFEDGSARKVMGELRLDEHHSRQAIGPLPKSADGRIDAASMQALRAVLNQQFGRFNWLFRLKGDDEPQLLAVEGAPIVEVEEERVVLRVRYAVTNPKPAKLWTLHCADPTFYWATRFDNGSGSAPRPSAPGSSGATPSHGHRNIEVEAKADDAAALRLDACPGRRAPSAGERRDEPRKGIAQLDWVCAP